jgi:N-carbamoyl-L-amino-acid hydrolase
LQAIEMAVHEICTRRGIVPQLELLNADPPAFCDPALIGAVEHAARSAGLRAMRMISRAYHDSLFMAQVCPTTMIFIPCRGGVSHRPDEFSSPDQIRDGVRVLAATIAALATREDRS